MKPQGNLVTLTNNFMTDVKGLSVITIAIIAIVGLIGAIYVASELYKYLQDDNTRSQATALGYVLAFIVCAIMTISPIIVAAISLLFVNR